MNTDPPSIYGYSDFSLIGQGGSATVFRARQNDLDRFVAIKVLRLGSVDDRQRRLFDDERKALGRLPKHQNVVTVFDSGFSNEGDPYLVMELCSLGSVASFVKANGPLEIEQTVRIGLRVATALEFAHGQGLVHRDIKPENVLVSNLGEPVLSDFGVAAMLDADASTNDGFSPHHVSPETLRGAPPAPSADMYSLGSTIYTMHYGKAPHQQARGERLLVSQILARVADPTFTISMSVDANVPAEFYQLLRVLLAKDPSRRMSRPGDAMSVLARVEGLLGTAGRRVNLILVSPPVAALPNAQEPNDDEQFDPDATFVPSKPLPLSVSKEAGPDDFSLSGSSVSYGTGQFTNSPHSNFDPRPGAGAQKTVNPGFEIDDWVGKRKLSTKTLLVAGAVVVVALTLALVSRFVARSPEAVDTTMSPSTEPSSQVPLVAPRDVQATLLPNNEVKISWSGDFDPSIVFDLAIRDGGSTVTATESASQPVVMSLSAVRSNTACVVVSSVDPSSGLTASADPTCFDRTSP